MLLIGFVTKIIKISYFFFIIKVNIPKHQITHELRDLLLYFFSDQLKHIRLYLIRIEALILIGTQLVGVLDLWHSCVVILCVGCVCSVHARLARARVFTKMVTIFAARTTGSFRPSLCSCAIVHLRISVVFHAMRFFVANLLSSFFLTSKKIAINKVLLQYTISNAPKYSNKFDSSRNLFSYNKKLKSRFSFLVSLVVFFINIFIFNC